MRNYCTIFDKNYLFQGMALFVSLLRTTKNFRLYVLCMDAESFQLIEKFSAKLPITAIREEDLRTAIPALEEHKKRTSHGQYCWSCQPFSISYLIHRFQLDSLTYLEADSIFFSDPEHLFAEIGPGSVSLVPHRYTPEFDQTKTSGRYCVQFNFFRNDAQAKAVLDYWQSCCLEYSREKPLFYPGQTKLDEWPEKFGSSVVEIQNLGAGIAPWNIQQYSVSIEDGIPMVDGQAAVFYHFHEFAFRENGAFDLGGYPLSKQVVDAFYRPYVATLRAAEAMVHEIAPDFRHRKVRAAPVGFLNALRVWKRKLFGRYNVFTAKEL